MKSYEEDKIEEMLLLGRFGEKTRAIYEKAQNDSELPEAAIVGVYLAMKGQLTSEEKTLIFPNE